MQECQAIDISLPAHPSTVHHLPCKIAHNGPAAVSSYFLPRKTEGPSHAACARSALAWHRVIGSHVYDCVCALVRVSVGVCSEGKDVVCFRGKLLEGAAITLPPGFQGACCHDPVLFWQAAWDCFKVCPAFARGCVSCAGVVLKRAAGGDLSYMASRFDSDEECDNDDTAADSASGISDSKWAVDAVFDSFMSWYVTKCLL